MQDEPGLLHNVQWTMDASLVCTDHMGIYLSGADVVMAQQFLNTANVGSPPEQCNHPLKSVHA